MQKAGYVFAQVRTLLDDQEQDFATDDYIQPFLASAQDDLVAECLRDPNIGQIKAAIVLPAVPAGTTSLAQYFMPGGALELLTNPIELREKQAGTADINYVTMIPRGTPTRAVSQNGYNSVYCWTGVDIILPGANQALDIWVWGSCAPAVIVNAETPLVNTTETILKYATAKQICRSRGNRELMRDFQQDQAVQQSAWLRNIYKIQQSIRVVNRPWRPMDTPWVNSPSS